MNIKLNTTIEFSKEDKEHFREVRKMIEGICEALGYDSVAKDNECSKCPFYNDIMCPHECIDQIEDT